MPGQTFPRILRTNSSGDIDLGRIYFLLPCCRRTSHKTAKKPPMATTTRINMSREPVRVECRSPMPS